MAGTISIRAFAKECGVSDTTIHKAIDAGHIDKGVDWNEDRTKKRGIFRDIALKEWRNNHSGIERPTKAGTLNLHAVPGKGIKKTPGVLPPKETAPPAKQQESEEGASIATIRKHTAAVEYKLKKLDLEKKEGSLVEKAEVYKQLFNVGKELREAIMIIPDRVIDNLLAANRNDAHAMLYKELEGALEAVSRLGTMNFSPQAE